MMRPSTHSTIGNQKIFLPIFVTSVYMISMGIADVHAQMGFTVYPSRYQIEARYITQFPRFVNWPDSSFASPKSPIVVGVIGQDPFGIDLDKAVQGQKIKERYLVVRRVQNVQTLGKCHVLYLGSIDTEERNRILENLAEEAILTISNDDDFLKFGGMIALFVEEKHVRFNIDQEAVQHAGLRMSSRLLKLSHKNHNPISR